VLPPEFQRDPTGYLLRCARADGPIAEIWPSASLLSDPDDIAFVLRHSGERFSRTGNILGEPVFAEDSLVWGAGRRAVTGCLRSRVESVARCAVDHAFEHLISDWPDQPAAVLPRLEAATSLIIGEICFADDSPAVLPVAGELLGILFEAGSASAEMAAELEARARDCQGRLLREIRSIVADRIGLRSSADLAGLLAHEDFGNLKSDLATRMLVSVLLAGYGVPAMALAWTLYLLEKYPDEKCKVAQEVGAAELSVANPVLPLTQAVVQEALRLYPPTWLLARRALGAETIHGIAFPSGHAFYMSSFITGRDARFFDRPTRYVPGRWLGDRDRHPVGSYFPYGAGSRFCLGQALANLEVKLLTARITRECNFQVVEPEKVRLDATRGLRPAYLSATVTRL
jgi:cytochrome P450